MIKRRKRGAFLSAMLILAMLASACTNTGSNKSPDAEPTGTQKTESPSADEVVRLEVLSLPSNSSGLVEGWLGDILREQAGVELDLLPAGDQGLQRLQTLMAGGSLPDIVVFQTKKQLEDAIQAKLVTNLDQHLDKLPNVVQNVPLALEYYRQSVSYGTGQLYGIPSNVGPSEVGPELNWTPYMRWDLYKQLGMPKIETLEDYLPILQQMQQLEPVNENGQKVYGLSLFKDWDFYSMYNATQPSMYIGVDTGDLMGANMPLSQVDLTTGELQSLLDPEGQYIRALKFYFQANQMGLLDPDSLTQRFDTVVEKMGQNRVLFSFWSWLLNNKEEMVNGDPPRGFRPVLADNFKGVWGGDIELGNPWAFAISSSTKNLDGALRFLDYIYSFEGMENLRNGPRGVIWDLDSQGSPYVTEQGWDILVNDKELPAGGKPGNPLNVSPLSSTKINPATNAPIGWDFWESSQKRNPSKLMADWQAETGYSTTTEMLKADGRYVVAPRAAKLLEAPSDEISAIAARIGDVVKTNSWMAVFASDQAQFDKLVQEMIEKAQTLGLDEVMERNQLAWKKAQEESDKYE